MQTNLHRRTGTSAATVSGRRDGDVPAVATPDPAPSIVPIQARGTRPPLIWVGLRREVLLLKRALGPDQPLLAISIEELEERDDFAGYARQVAEAVCAAYPRDAYCLGGSCTAGTLAYEIGVQLRAAGKLISLIVLLDAVNPVKLRSLSRWRARLSKLSFDIRQIVRHGDGDRLNYIGGKLKGLVRLIRTSEADPSSWIEGPIQARIERSAYAYSAPALECDVLFLQPEEHATLDDRSGSWKDVVRGRLEVCRVPGSHITMTHRTRGEAVAGRIRDALLHAELRAGSMTA